MISNDVIQRALEIVRKFTPDVGDPMTVAVLLAGAEVADEIRKAREELHEIRYELTEIRRKRT